MKEKNSAGLRGKQVTEIEKKNDKYLRLSSTWKKSTNKQYVPNSLEAKKRINSGKLRNYLKLAETMGKEHGR